MIGLAENMYNYLRDMMILCLNASFTVHTKTELVQTNMPIQNI